MSEIIVTQKELREKFCNAAVDICNFAQRGRGRPSNTVISGLIDPSSDEWLPESERLFGTRRVQMNADIGVLVLREIVRQVREEGRVLEQDLTKRLSNETLFRQTVTSWLNGMVRFKDVEGFNDLDGLRKGLGRLVVVGKKGRLSIYVARAGASDAEVFAFIDLKFAMGKSVTVVAQRMRERAQRAWAGRSGRLLDDLYAEECTRQFKASEAA